MRFRFLAALAAALGLAGAAAAQPPKAEPTLEVRLRSANDLITKAEYLTGLAGKDELVKQLREIVKTLSADGKGIEGVDPTKPFGLTATLTPGVVDSDFLLMVPVADKERFLKMLADRLQLAAEKDAADADLYKVPAPVITEAYVRFANGYAFAGRTKDAVAPKGLPDPKTYFGKDDGAVASAVVHIDRVPEQLKKLLLDQFDTGVTEQLKKGGAPDAVKQPLGDNVTSAARSLVEDTKTVAAKVFVDEKGDELSGEFTLTAKPGSVLAKNLAALGGKTSLPAGIVGTAGGAARVTAKMAVPAGVKNDFGKIIDTAFEEALKDVDDQGRPIVEKIFKAIAPTLKAGELDLGVALSAANAKGEHTLLAAVGVKQGKEIEKLVKDLEKEFGGFVAEAVAFDFDVAKVGDFNLHKITLKAMPEEFEKVFGGNKVWVAISDDCIAVSVEPEGTALKAGLKAKAVPVPVLSVDVAFAKLVPLVAQARGAGPDEVKAILKDAFKGADPAGKDTLTLTVTGGDRLTVKGALKGGAVRLAAGLALGKRID